MNKKSGSSKERRFGKFRGEIARSLFALEMSKGSFNPQNYEALYRDLVIYGLIEGIFPGAKSDAKDMRHWFWSELYQRCCQKKLC